MCRGPPVQPSTDHVGLTFRFVSLMGTSAICAEGGGKSNTGQGDSQGGVSGLLGLLSKPTACSHAYICSLVVTRLFLLFLGGLQWCSGLGVGVEIERVPV